MVFKGVSVARNCLRPKSVHLGALKVIYCSLDMFNLISQNCCFLLKNQNIVLMHCIAYDVNRISKERF